jgi:hypothetical protein
MGLGNYLVVILSLGSPLFLAKSHLFPSLFYDSFPDEAMQTAIGFNLFQVRNGIIQRDEQVASMIWLALAVFLDQPFMAGWQAVSLGCPSVDILVALEAGAVAWFVTMALIKWCSARVYRPRIIKMERDRFARQAFIVSHAGYTQEQIGSGENVPEELRQRRLMEAAQALDTIGTLLDQPRREGETDEQFVERLTPHFSSQPVDGR